MVSRHVADDLEIKTLDEKEIGRIDRIFRAAFSLQVHHNNPETFAPGRSCLARLHAEPHGAFGAHIAGELVAVAFGTIWGSVGVFGPLAVQPGSWNMGLGSALLQKTIEFFESRSVRDKVLCTFPDSVKHVSLYQRFEFHPAHLIGMMSKLTPAFPSDVGILELYSESSAARRKEILAECRRITEAIYAGLDVSKEVEVVEKLSIGDTIILSIDSRIVAFAICHYGAGSETESDVLYIKFAAALPCKSERQNFRTLLSHCSAYAQNKKANMIFFGVNTARQKAYSVVMEDGFKLDSLSLAMQSPYRALYNHPGIYVLDDWR